jgi:hypothetical protein
MNFNRMKNLKKLSFLFIFLGSTVSFSQDWSSIEFESATVDANYCLQLDATKPVAEFYEMDIAFFGFTDAVEAKKQFNTRANNFVSYHVDLAEQKAYCHLHLDRTPAPMDIVWWNEYLASLCASE